MNIERQDILLDSSQHFEGRLPTHHIGHLFSNLPLAIRGAVSMALRKRSKTRGRLPDWLLRASDIRFIGFGGNGSTQLQFEVPSLGSAAKEIYAQRELFESSRPSEDKTGLDLLMQVIQDIELDKADSETFDPQLLTQVSRFNRFFKSSPFSSFHVTGSNASQIKEVIVNLETHEKCQRLYGSIPKPQRVRIVGVLDGIEASTQRFSLLLDSGDRIPGVFPEELSDSMQELWRTRTLVIGSAVYRVSGNLLRIEADSIESGEQTAGVFTRLPLPGRSRLDSNRIRKTQGPRSGMAAIMGKWPGEETEEDIEAALEWLS